MKRITLQFTDVQYHYLTQLAEGDLRTVDSLLYVLLHWGCVVHYSENVTCLDILPGDYTDEELAKANEPDCLNHITRIAYIADNFADLIGFSQLVTDPNGAIADDAERNLDKEIEQLENLKKMYKARLDERNQKLQAEWLAEQAKSSSD